MKSTFFLLLFCLSSLVQAENSKEIVIASESWKGATNRDGTGLYWDLVQAIYEPLGYIIIKKHKSYNEAAEMVRVNNADIFLGSYLNEKPYALYPKYHFDQDVIVAIFRNDVIDNWEGEKSLEGLKVGWVRGYDFDKYLKAKVKVVELSNRSNGLKQLKNERLDAFLDDRDDIKPYLHKAKLNSNDFEKKIIMQEKLYPAFAKTKKGRSLKALWDKQMKKLIKNDAFKQIYFESEYTIFPY